MITGLNHITLAASDLKLSVAFYCDVLGARITACSETNAYLDLGGIWLCLSQGPVAPKQDYSHIALTVAAEAFDTFRRRVLAACAEWQPNASEGDSVYFLDPDGHRLEIHAGDMQSRLQHYRDHPDLGVTVVE